VNKPIRIGNYTLRPATERDRDLLAVWIEGDPDHRDKVKPEFFCVDREGMECFALEDEFGHVVLYIKMTRVMRLDIQFGPDETMHQRERTADAMREGFQWLRAGAQGAAFHEILFRSTNPPLIAFAKRRLAFDSAPDELIHRITSLATYKTQDNPLHREQ
jgi:hypothetical protein